MWRCVGGAVGRAAEGMRGEGSGQGSSRRAWAWQWAGWQKACVGWAAGLCGRHACNVGGPRYVPASCPPASHQTQACPHVPLCAAGGCGCSAHEGHAGQPGACLCVCVCGLQQLYLPHAREVLCPLTPVAVLLCRRVTCPGSVKRTTGRVLAVRCSHTTAGSHAQLLAAGGCAAGSKCGAGSRPHPPVVALAGPREQLHPD